MGRELKVNDLRNMKPRFIHLLLLIYLALFLVRHLEIFFGWAVLPHFEEIVSAFKKMDQGSLFFPGPDLWKTGLRAGGSIYYWLHYPARLIQNPVLAMHLYYAALELAGIALFLLLGPRAGLSRDNVLAGGLFLVSFFSSKQVICENVTVAGYLSVLLFVILLWAARSAALLPCLLTGALLSALIQIHMTALFIIPVLLLALFMIPERRPSRALAVLAGFALVVAMNLPGMEQPEQRDLTFTWQVLFQQFSLQNFAGRLQSVFESPLCLLGLILIAAAMIRPRRPAALPASAPLKLTLAWWLTIYLQLCLALSYMGGFYHLEHRLALLNPARAVLAGAALVALGESR